jgi:hypothetical protein
MKSLALIALLVGVALSGCGTAPDTETSEVTESSTSITTSITGESSSLSSTSTSTSLPDPNMTGASPIFDFSIADSALGWSVVNDTVMGGVSSGQLAMEDGLMIFSGELSLDNNGGFASVRSPAIESRSTQSSNVSWADRSGPRIVVQGDGRTWTVEVRTDDESGGWIASLPTSPDMITDVTIPWTSFEPVTRFLDPRDAVESLEPSRIVSIAFYLVDGIEGPFRLGIQSIS